MDNVTQIYDLQDSLLNNHASFIFSINETGSSAVKEIRKQAILRFSKQGFPTTANEEWKYSNILPLLKKDYSLHYESLLLKEEIAPFFYKGLIANNIVCINGVYSEEYSSIIESGEVFEIKTLYEADPSLLEVYLGKNDDVNDAFSNLNLAYAKDGIVVTIKENAILQHPLVLYFISDTHHQPVFTQSRNIIIAEKGAQAQIVESYHSVGMNTVFSNTVTEVYLKEGTSLDYYKIQNNSETSNHIGSTQVLHLGKSNFSSTTLTFNGALIRNNLNICLKSPYSEVYMNGLYFLNNKMHVDNHTLVDHAVPNCYSNELYKGVLAGSSTGVFNGKIMVRKDAQKTNAFQSNKNILLSKEATMNTKPQLEIFADDVKCSHGATIGQLDEEPLFYLRSRGLSEKSAKALLTLAFAEEVLEKIKISEIKEVLKEVLSEKFNTI